MRHRAHRARCTVHVPSCNVEAAHRVPHTAKRVECTDCTTTDVCRGGGIEKVNETWAGTDVQLPQ